jgi:hypothetical protein
MEMFKFPKDAYLMQNLDLCHGSSRVRRMLNDRDATR